MADYANNWNQYYEKTYKLLKSKSLWEVSPDISAAEDYNKFKSDFNSDLPLIDIGCGTGEQVNYLTRFYDKVIGLDVAENAIEIAKSRYGNNNIFFETFDLSDTLSAERIYEKYGPSNLYLRGVIHQTKPEDRIEILNSIKILLGGSGKMYFIEVGQNIREHLKNNVSSFSLLPSRMQSALMSNLPPIGLSTETLKEWFPSDQFKIIKSGNDFLATNLQLPDNSMLAIPAIYAVVEMNK